jgi:hypothetical protein
LPRVAVDAVIEGTVSIHAVVRDDGLSLKGRGIDLSGPWESVTGAGLVRLPRLDLAQDEPEMSKLLPGMGRLNAASLALTGRNRLLLTAQAREWGRPRAFTIPLPREDPNAELLLGELRQRLGSRWRGDDREQRELRRELGATYPLWYRPVGLLFVLFIAAVTILAAAAWGFLAGGDSGIRPRLSDARWWTFAGLAVWLGLCALLLFAARRASGEDHAWRFAAPIPLLLLIAVLTPPAVATFELIEDWRFSAVEPAPLLALVIWLGLLLVAARFVRKLLD